MVREKEALKDPGNSCPGQSQVPRNNLPQIRIGKCDFSSRECGCARSDPAAVVKSTEQMGSERVGLLRSTSATLWGEQGGAKAVENRRPGRRSDLKTSKWQSLTTRLGGSGEARTSLSDDFSVDCLGNADTGRDTTERDPPKEKSYEFSEGRGDADDYR